jgi:hypothetical protein
MINLKNDELTNCCLYSDKCRHGGIQLIAIGNKDCVHCLWNTLVWYPSQLIAEFLTICQHDAHVSTPPPFKTDHQVMMVLTTYPGNKEQIKDVIDYGDAMHFILVVYSSSHYAVLYYDIEQCTVTVYDGLKYCITEWQDHIIHTIKMYELQLAGASA